MDRLLCQSILVSSQKALFTKDALVFWRAAGVSIPSHIFSMNHNVVQGAQAHFFGVKIFVCLKAD